MTRVWAYRHEVAELTPEEMLATLLAHDSGIEDPRWDEYFQSLCALAETSFDAKRLRRWQRQLRGPPVLRIDLRSSQRGVRLMRLSGALARRLQFLASLREVAPLAERRFDQLFAAAAHGNTQQALRALTSLEHAIWLAAPDVDPEVLEAQMRRWLVEQLERDPAASRRAWIEWQECALFERLVLARCPFPVVVEGDEAEVATLCLTLLPGQTVCGSPPRDARSWASSAGEPLASAEHLTSTFLGSCEAGFTRAVQLLADAGLEPDPALAAPRFDVFFPASSRTRRSRRRLDTAGIELADASAWLPALSATVLSALGISTCALPISGSPGQLAPGEVDPDVARSKGAAARAWVERSGTQLAEMQRPLIAPWTIDADQALAPTDRLFVCINRAIVAPELVVDSMSDPLGDRLRNMLDAGARARLRGNSSSRSDGARALGLLGVGGQACASRDDAMTHARSLVAAVDVAGESCSLLFCDAGAKCAKGDIDAVVRREAQACYEAAWSDSAAARYETPWTVSPARMLASTPFAVIWVEALDGAVGRVRRVSQLDDAFKPGRVEAIFYPTRK